MVLIVSVQDNFFNVSSAVPQNDWKWLKWDIKRHKYFTSAQSTARMNAFVLFSTLTANISPDSKADMLQDVGQRDVFCLKGLPLLLELVCQADTPALLGDSISRLLGDIPTHKVRCGFLTPVCSHCSRIPSCRELGVVNGSKKTVAMTNKRCPHLLSIGLVYFVFTKE